MKERNDIHGDEQILELLRRKPERDPDDDSPGFCGELGEDLSAQYRSEIALSGTPDEFRKVWGKL